MRPGWRLGAAFVRRDWANESSYRAMIAFEGLNLIGSIIVFYAIGELVNGHPDALAPYGGEYFPFALVGLAVSGYFTISITSFANRLRIAQTTGTLEAMLTTPVSGGVILLLSGIWDYILATFRLLVYVGIGVGILGVSFDVNLEAAIPLALFSLIGFAATGLIVASAMLVVKRGESLGSVIATAAGLLGGLLFPVSLLPERIRFLHYFVPLYYSLDGLRRSLLVGAGPGDLAGSLVGTVVSALLLVGAARFTIRWSMRRTRAEASVGHY